jgi:hypothetical protein
MMRAIFIEYTNWAATLLVMSAMLFMFPLAITGSFAEKAVFVLDLVCSVFNLITSISASAVNRSYISIRGGNEYYEEF